MARACSFDAGRPDLKQELYLLGGNNVESNHYLDKPCRFDQIKQAEQRTEVGIWPQMACYPCGQLNTS